MRKSTRGIAAMMLVLVGSVWLTEEACGQEPMMGEVRMFAGNFAPRGWALCDGQLLPISENNALFSLLGTTYGGDGRTTFGLPDLRGRTPVHVGKGPGLSDRKLGEKRGAETVSLVGAKLVQPSEDALKSVLVPNINQPLNNMQPTLTINFIIALDGIYPSRN